MSLTVLGKESFRLIGYCQSEIKSNDFKFKTSIFVINNSMDFDLIIGTDVIHQGTLTVFSSDVKIHKSQNEPKPPILIL